VWRYLGEYDSKKMACSISEGNDRIRALVQRATSWQKSSREGDSDRSLKGSVSRIRWRESNSQNPMPVVGSVGN